jgi:hypothetical protein
LKDAYANKPLKEQKIDTKNELWSFHVRPPITFVGVFAHRTALLRPQIQSHQQSWLPLILNTSIQFCTNFDPNLFILFFVNKSNSKNCSLSFGRGSSVFLKTAPYNLFLSYFNSSMTCGGKKGLATSRQPGFWCREERMQRRLLGR